MTYILGHKLRLSIGRTLKKINRAWRHDHFVSGPVPAEYRSDVVLNVSTPTLVMVPIHECRTFGALGAKPRQDGIDPLIRTASEILQNKSQALTTPFIQQFYEVFQPSHAGSLLGLTSSSISANLTLSPRSFQYPWNGCCLEYFAQKRTAHALNENQAIHPKTRCRDWTQNGPVSKEKVEIEIKRMRCLLNDISRNGYVHPSTPREGIHATPLIDQNVARFHIGPGHHRFAALVALGWDEVPLVIGNKSRSRVQRSKVRSWPAVKKHCCTDTEALYIFDRIFHGHIHPLLKDLARNNQ